MRSSGLLSTTAGLLLVVACTQTPPTPAPAAPAADATGAGLTPVLSVKELMEHIIDPVADWIFDAAAIDISAAGVTETKPVTDDDWLKVERGALTLAEASNLLKMTRAMAPPGSERTNEPGKPAPELSTAEIQAKIDGDRALWNTHADKMRTASLEVLAIVKTRNADKLFDAGTVIDKACESCHLEYWYPGDKKLVEADQKNRVYFTPPKP
jgi:cytochrome c556